MTKYGLAEAARLVGVKRDTLLDYSRLGRLNSTTTENGLQFDEADIQSYVGNRWNIGRGRKASQEDRVKNFRRRYGKGAYEMLLFFFSNPEMSYAEIGEEFGVSREIVRRWNDAFVPEEKRRISERCRLSKIS